MDKEKNDINNWFVAYSDELFQYAQFKVKFIEDAEDLVQETFISALKSYANFEGKSSPKTWLFSILKHKIIDHYRKTINNIVSLQIEEEYVAFSDTFFKKNGSWKKEFFELKWDSDSHLLDDNLFIETLSLCINKLPDKWRKAIQAKYLLEQEGKIICKELNISESNYWQILHRGKILIKHCVDKNWFKTA